MLTQMLIRVFLGPIVLAICSVFAYFLFGWFLPGILSRHKIFALVVMKAEGVAAELALAIFGLSILWFLVQLFQLWQWEKGNGASCDSCGGMAALKRGRYGQYFKCYACGRRWHE